VRAAGLSDGAEDGKLELLGSPELLPAWVLGTLGGLAKDDEHHARLRGTLLVFLQSGGSYKTTAERLMLHKNTVQYPQGGGEPRAAGGREPPRRGTRAARRCCGRLTPGGAAHRWFV
jgi:PucR C-terminal helix-turn-helix domain